MTNLPVRGGGMGTLKKWGGGGGGEHPSNEGMILKWGEG